MLETIVAAVILLGILIFVHELGHFLVAKKSGVGVEKFSLGFGPKVFGRKVGETEYLLSAIPLGGYVKMVGENPDEEDIVSENAFNQKPVTTRLAIVAAGPVFNLVFAVLLLSLVFMMGVERPSDEPVVGKVLKDYPGEAAGLKAGDRITSVGEKSIEEWNDMAEIVHKSPDVEVTLTVLRNGETFFIKVTPRKKTVKDLTDKEVEIGLIGLEREMVTERYGFFDSLYKGTVRTYDIIALTFWSIKKMIIGEISSKNIGGPIAIAQMAGKSVDAGFIIYLTFAAYISIQLGILNLLPIPILDGGHIFFFLLEAIMGKPVNLQIREKAQQVGIFMLLSLMVFAFYNDIMRLFEG